MGIRKPKIKSRFSVWWDPISWLGAGPFSIVSSYNRRSQCALWGLFYKAMQPNMKAPYSRLNHLWKAPPNTLSLGIMFQHMNKIGQKHFFCSSDLGYPHTKFGLVCVLLKNKEEKASLPPHTWLSPFGKLQHIISGKIGKLQPSEGKVTNMQRYYM